MGYSIGLHARSKAQQRRMLAFMGILKPMRTEMERLDLAWSGLV